MSANPPIWSALIATLLVLSTGCQLGPPVRTNSPRTPAPTGSPVLPATPPESPSPPPPPTPGPSPTPDLPLTVQGGGRGSSGAFALRGGDYWVAYSLGGDCVYFGQLRSLAGATWPIDFAPHSGPARGSTMIHAVPAGDYAVDVTTGPAPACSWVITLTHS